MHRVLLAVATAFLTLAIASPALAIRAFGVADAPMPEAPGWQGFLDTRFMLEELGSLVLATVLAGFIAFHPMTARTVDTLHEAELPRVHIFYAIVGALVGVLVQQYGMVIGFIVFGLGGLMRFRTDTESTRATGRLIIVTLLGLIVGMDLPHVAVVATVFTWVLIWLFDSHPICRVEINDIPNGRMAESVGAYRDALQRAGCKILSEKKSLSKHRVAFVFRLPRQTTQERVHTVLCNEPPETLRGDINWEVE